MVMGAKGQRGSPLGHKNNFDLLRLALAMGVCIAHAYLVSGFDGLEWVARIISGTSLVKAFFVISGFLVFMSYEQAASIRSYAIKRMRRIYPAYLTIVILSALVLPVLTLDTMTGYFSVHWVKYVISNLTFLNFLQPTISGVFSSNLDPTINGSLWTIKVEVMFYACVPLFVALFRRFSHLPVLLFFYCLSILYSSYFMGMSEATGSEFYRSLGRQLPGQLSYFMSGAFMYYFMPSFKRHIKWYVIVSFLVLLVDGVYALTFFVPFALGTVVIFCGVSCYLGNFGRFGDFSYGVYIVHFPIIQLLLHFNVLVKSPNYFLLLVVVLTLLGGYLMWHLVEKRFLFRTSHYVSSAKGR
jgi:peptidoglycan/LPS O-acetylase OafA/YrhL